MGGEKKGTWGWIECEKHPCFSQQLYSKLDKYVVDGIDCAFNCHVTGISVEDTCGSDSSPL